MMNFREVNEDDILKECGKLVNTVNLRKKEEK